VSSIQLAVQYSKFLYFPLSIFKSRKKQIPAVSRLILGAKIQDHILGLSTFVLFSVAFTDSSQITTNTNPSPTQNFYTKISVSSWFKEKLLPVFFRERVCRDYFSHSKSCLQNSQILREKHLTDKYRRTSVVKYFALKHFEVTSDSGNKLGTHFHMLCWEFLSLHTKIKLGGGDHMNCITYWNLFMNTKHVHRNG